jgi:quercetin 2,3-dioxygenase
MTSTDLETMHDLAPVVNALPGEPVPYYLAGGEGLRFEIGGQLWTVIARGSDTGGLFDAAFVLGPRGSEAPFHSLPAHQHSYYVFEGCVQFWLPGRSRVLVPGDSVHVPPGTPVAYRMLGHMSRLLFFSASSGALDALAGSRETVERHVYTPAAPSAALLPGAREHDLGRVDAQDVWDDTLPDGE